MKKRKPDTIVAVSDINENILNIITPSGIDFNNSYASVGENQGKIYCISKYPTNVDYGWLGKLCNLEGTSTTIEYRYTTPERMQTVMDKKIEELNSEKGTVKEASEKAKLDKAIKDLNKMIHRIIIQNEPVGYVNIMLHVQALNNTDLNIRTKRISSAVAIEGCNIKNLKYRQLSALKAISPYGIPNFKEVSNMGERNMPIGSFLGGFPMANAGLNDIDGYYIGKTKDMRLVRINMWLRMKDRINSNWFVTGLPGVGKSTILKLIFLKEYALGTKIILFDPEREYVDLAKHSLVNGDVINCGGGDNGRINPLQIRSVPKVTKEDLEEGELESDFMIFDEAHGISEMAYHIQQSRVFFKLYFGVEAFDFEIKTILEQCLIELYHNFDINWATETGSLRNNQFPIMSDLYSLVTGKADVEKDPYSKSIYRKLSMLLYSAAEGADSGLWNGYTTINPKSKFTVLDVSSLHEVDENVKRAQYFLLSTWSWQESSADRTEKVLFGLDEGYLFVDPENPDLMKYLRNYSKRARKYEAGLMFITHSCVDVLDPAVKRFGQAIIDNSCYKFLMGCDGKNLKETQELFDLTENEATILSSKNRSQGVFMCGGIHLDLKVDVKTEFLEIFGTAGGR